MARFALLRHDSPRGTHWDLLLEKGTSLRTWSLPQFPAPGAAMICEALADHRLEYLDYEGPISGSRGSVAREDHGTYRVQRESEGDLVVTLEGRRLVGRLALRQESPEAASWRCVFETPGGAASGG